VRDHGPVIPSRDQERLFRPFSRLGETGSDSAGGSGLGLAICRQLAILMGGQIGYSTHRFDTGEAGNEFWLTLPVTEQPARPKSAVAPKADATPPPLPRTRILLVEDIQSNQVITSTLLRRDGHYVDVASNAEQALAAIECTPYDIVLTDIHMPGMSGTDMTRLIRKLGPPGCALPIFALSGSTSPAMTACCREAGLDGVLGKPVDLAELRAAIGEAVWGTSSGRTGTGGQASAGAPPRSNLLNETRVRELKSGLPPAILAAAAAECAAELQQRHAALRIALTAANAADARFQVHAMLGVAGSYGLAGLEQALRRIMGAIRDDDLQTAMQTTAYLGSEMQLGLDALQQTLETEATES
jgi:two-component system sensor histidine kinase TorS